MHTYLDKTASLTPVAKRIICNKATEHPHSGSYNKAVEMGTYLCRRCGFALFRANSQFSCGCGWPSFDVNIPQAVKELPDVDGLRTEIICNRCNGHLGHVFNGEQFTATNRRYCVNSASIDFVSDDKVLDTKEAILAGGCFWGVDYYLRRVPGVLKVEAGYSGGTIVDPTYKQVCQGNTGHYEADRVVYDSAQTDYSTILKAFFEIHDFTQRTGQGPDIGPQYKSAIFYYNENQQVKAETLIQQLRQKSYDVATRLLPVQPFFAAEDYHQEYYAKHQSHPYCHHRKVIFGSDGTT